MISTSFCASGNPRIRPMRASGMPKRAGSAAIRRSQCKASSQPPAMASPWTTAMVACREPSMRRSTGTTPASGSLLATRASISFRSRPEQKAGPAPRKTITRTSLRASRPSMPSPSRRSIAAFIALRCSGRLSVTVAMPSATASRISSDMARCYQAGRNSAGTWRRAPANRHRAQRRGGPKRRAIPIARPPSRSGRSRRARRARCGRRRRGRAPPARARHSPPSWCPTGW